MQEMKSIHFLYWKMHRLLTGYLKYSAMNPVISFSALTRFLLGSLCRYTRMMLSGLVEKS